MVCNKAAYYFVYMLYPIPGENIERIVAGNILVAVPCFQAYINYLRV